MACETFGIWNDQQIPYHDPQAFEVALQVFEDAKLGCLVYNGDWGDYRSLSKYPAVGSDRPDMDWGLSEELERQRELLKLAQKRIKPKRAIFNEGNHEWRVRRALERDEKLVKLLDLGDVRDSVSIHSLLRLNDLGIAWSGRYPKGSWLHPSLAPHDNVWVEHGYITRKNAGYGATALMQERMCSVVVGHCERLALIWKRALGRDFFGIENGNLSLIGEPERGSDIYSGVPFSEQKYLNHRQGICVIYRQSNEWWPVPVRIRDGKAWFNGRLYKC